MRSPLERSPVTYWAWPLLFLPAVIIPFTHGFGAAMSVGVLCFILFVTIQVVANHRWRRRWRRYYELDHRMCLKCGFDMRGLPDAGQCPECGNPYERVEDLLRMHQARNNRLW